MHPFIELMINRRSVRSYRDEAVDGQLLEQILQAGLYAPSGGNHQYVRLFVIKDRERLEQLNRALVEAFAAQELDSSRYQNKSAVRARQSGCHFFFHAPVLISAVSPRSHPNSMADSANALQNIQLAATALGLGACWINQPHWLTDHPTVRELFSQMGMRGDEDIFGSAAIGYSAQSDRPPLPRAEGRVLFG